MKTKVKIEKENKNVRSHTSCIINGRREDCDWKIRAKSQECYKGGLSASLGGVGV